MSLDGESLLSALLLERAKRGELERAVAEFARRLTTQPHPERLWITMSTPGPECMIRCGRQLERERVGSELLRLLEDAGVDIHADER